MRRRKVPRDVEEIVLVLSRRRCCVCFGLNRDTALKRGQVAHLDHDPNNNNRSNLAFLCFDHHDEYDANTSQSKGLTLGEVRRFREELHDAIEAVWKRPLAFGGREVPLGDSVEGHYTREGVDDSAELDVWRLRDGRVRVEGTLGSVPLLSVFSLIS